MDIKELTTNILKQEFSDLLIDIRYWGPHEDEDLDVDVVLKEEPIDLDEKEDKIYYYLREQGFDVLFDYQFKDNSTEISKMGVKELTEKLIQQEFGEWLIEMQFSGPFEWEDLDVNVVLSKEPADWVDRSYRVRRKLRDEGFDVLIAYDVLDGSDLAGKVKACYYIPMVMQDGKVCDFPSPKPLSPQAAQDFKRAAELTKELRKLPKEERIKFYEESMEKSRCDAIERGIALDKEEDAAIED